MRRTKIIDGNITCWKCGLTKNTDYFEPRPEHNSYRNVCRSCNKGYKVNSKVAKQQRLELFNSGLKECGTCKTIKQISEFGYDKHTRFQLTSQCKSCIKIKSKKKQKSNALKYKYNLTVDKYNLLLVKQNFKCAICFNDLELNKYNKVHVDHCHKKSHVRGILCINCNLGLGFFKDSILNLKAATLYLINDCRTKQSV